MSIDTLGARAADDLRTAVSLVDVESAVADTLTRRRPVTTRATTAAVAIAVLVLVLGWAGSRVLDEEHPAPPLQAPNEVVGNQLSVPVELTVPDGWRAARDTASVVLLPDDGSNRSITLVGQPVRVYEPPAYQVRPLREDLAVWTTTRRDLLVSDRFGFDGPDFAWTGTEMELALRPGIASAPLVPLPGGYDPLSITDADRTYLWDVIYFTDSPPLLVASRSDASDDTELKEARNALLQSLQFQPPPSQE